MKLAALGLLLGASTAAPDSTITVIAQYGTAGVIAYLLITGKLASAAVLERALADRDREHGELIELRRRLDEQVTPALIRATDVMARLATEEGKPRA